MWGFTVWGLGFRIFRKTTEVIWGFPKTRGTSHSKVYRVYRDITPTMENQTEQRMKNEMNTETEIIWVYCRV